LTPGADPKQIQVMGSPRIRLDEILVSRGLAENRSRARALIMAGQVRSGTEVLDKPGRTVPHDLPLTVATPARYVSRGAEKLAGFFERFPWPVNGRCILDIGASTGGFTDYLLQAGAREATCVDVGHGQLHYRLRTDPRVINRERVNARHLKPADLPQPDYPLIVMDLSFISLRQVLPAAWSCLRQGGRLIALVKPQFEAGRREADRGRGVIRDPAIRQRILAEILQFAADELDGAIPVGTCESPIEGGNGNREFLAGWDRAPAADS
jgi:23S rRNA (cytidine1920-2'-O)/16S rRNA (cytidine1409-2'-O)-methyltransferase